MANWTLIKPGVYVSDTGSVIAEIPELGLCVVARIEADGEVYIPIEDLLSNPFQSFVELDQETGKIDPSVIPLIAINDVFIVSSQAEQLALDCQKGDAAIRTDEENQWYQLAGNDPSILAQWIPVSVRMVDLQARSDIAEITARLTPLEEAVSIIGDETLHTTARTLAGAINEIRRRPSYQRVIDHVEIRTDSTGESWYFAHGVSDLEHRVVNVAIVAYDTEGEPVHVSPSAGHLVWGYSPEYSAEVVGFWFNSESDIPAGVDPDTGLNLFIDYI